MLALHLVVRIRGHVPALRIEMGRYVLALVRDRSIGAARRWLAALAFRILF